MVNTNTADIVIVGNTVSGGDAIAVNSTEQ